MSFSDPEPLRTEQQITALAQPPYMLNFISIWTPLVVRIEATYTKKITKPKSVSTSPFILTLLCVLELDWALTTIAILQNLHCFLFLGTNHPDVERVDHYFLQLHKGLPDGPQPLGLVSHPYRGCRICSDVTMLILWIPDFPVSDSILLFYVCLNSSE